jgi:hypothetical protein
MAFFDQDNLNCVGIAAKRREYRFAQRVNVLLEKNYIKQQTDIEDAQKCLGELSSIIEEKNAKIKQLVEMQFIANVEYKIEVEKLKEESSRNVTLENGEIEKKLEIAVGRIGNLTFENDVLKNDSCNKEELLKAEILNLNKCISRKKEKCVDLSAEIEKLKKESDKITKKASESMKVNENLRIEVDKLKRDAVVQKTQSESSINKLQNDNQELQKQLKGGNLWLF